MVADIESSAVLHTPKQGKNIVVLEANHYKGLLCVVFFVCMRY